MSALEVARPSKRPTTIDKVRVELAVREILVAIGEDPTREGLVDTPRRVAEACEVLFSGVGKGPAQHIEARFGEGLDDAVLLKDLPFASVCEHHLLPMIGKAHVGYVPEGRVAGLSDLARVVDLCSRRPQLQERATAEIADALREGLGARGVIVVVETEQLCVTMRGIQKPGTTTVTSAARGLFAEDADARREMQSLMGS